MTDHEAKIIRIMEHCILKDGFCPDCESDAQCSNDCIRQMGEFIEMAKAAMAQRDALRADMDILRRTLNPCEICSHYRADQSGYQKCELHEWTCSWEWRGERNG